MKDSPLPPDQMDPMQFAKLVADIATEDAPVPEGWGHRRFVLKAVNADDGQPTQASREKSE